MLSYSTRISAAPLNANAATDTFSSADDLQGNVSDTKDKIRKIVKVGWHEQPGYSESKKNANGTITYYGYNYEYLQEIAKYTHWDYEFIIDDGEVLYEKVVNGEIDLMGSIGYDANDKTSAMRKDEVAFPDSSVAEGFMSLFVKSGSQIAANDFGALNNLKIGVRKSAAANYNALVAFLNDNNITGCDLVHYNDFSTMHKGVIDGEIDVGAIGGAYLADKETREIAKFAPSNYYFVTTKGGSDVSLAIGGEIKHFYNVESKPDILNGLNYAISQIKINNPYFDLKLSQKYFPATRPVFRLTEAEKAFINKNQTITVGYFGSSMPIDGNINDKFVGASADIFKKISEISGLNFKYVLMNDSKVTPDIISGIDNNFESANALGYYLSAVYLDLPIVLIKDPKNESQKTAIVDNYFSQGRYVNQFTEYDFMYYNSVEECIEAVRKGEAGQAIMNSYSAKKLMQNSKYAHLSSIMLQKNNIEVAVAVKSSIDAPLLSIINKAIGVISETETNDILIKNTTYNDKEYTLNDWIHNNLGKFVILISAFVGCGVGAIGMIILVSKKRVYEKRRANTLGLFMSYACKANDYVVEVNLHEKTQYRITVDGNEVIRTLVSGFSNETLLSMIHQDDIKEFLNTHPLNENLINTLFNCSFAELRIRTSLDRDFLWYRLSVQKMSVTEEQPNNYLIYLQNIDRLKKEDENEKLLLENALAVAENASVTKSEFTSRMSHEIRTPLNAIIGYIGLAKDEIKNTEKVMDYLTKASYATTYLLNIVSEVLDMSAIEGGKLQISDAELDIKELLQHLASIYIPQAKSKNINYINEFDKKIPKFVYSDKTRLSQVLLNLLSNAFKFTPAGGTIDCKAIVTGYTGNRVNMEFSIHDTGIGMDAEFLPNVFKPYEQQDKSISLHYGGSGLGLSICKSIINMMNGDITVESKKGIGTTFVVKLSFIYSETEEKEVLVSDTEDDNQEALKGKHILLAEDNDMNMEIAIAILEKWGCIIEGAENGQIALDKFTSSEDNYYDAILMDVRMPVLDGYAATEAIRNSAHSKASSIPIIAMTANALNDEVIQALSCGMNAYLSKPIDVKALYATLKREINNA